jgi:hypothetical protein
LALEYLDAAVGISRHGRTCRARQPENWHIFLARGREPDDGQCAQMVRSQPRLEPSGQGLIREKRVEIHWSLGQAHAMAFCGDAGMEVGVFIEFLKRLIKNAGREIFLIVDRGSAHRAKKAGAFVRLLGREIALVLSAFPCAGP